MTPSPARPLHINYQICGMTSYKLEHFMGFFYGPATSRRQRSLTAVDYKVKSTPNY